MKNDRDHGTRGRASSPGGPTPHQGKPATPRTTPKSLPKTLPKTTRGIMRQRKRRSGGTPPVGAGEVASQAARASAGQELPGPVRAEMEASFGRSLAEVRVHDDAAASRAAVDLNANAFTVGNDIYFDRGKYQPASGEGKRLLAHELAHVAQGDAVAASARGASISSPGDAAEVAADRAADAVMRGEPVPALGGAPASVIHRDAVDDVVELSEPNWLGRVDGDEILARIERLSAADKRRLADDTETIKRIFRRMSTSQCTRVFTHLYFSFNWRIYLLDQAGKLDELGVGGWRWMLANATPQDMESLRQYPSGYRGFLRDAPVELIPPWDKLAGLKEGTWTGSAVDVRNAVNQLSGDQKQAVRDDLRMLRAVVRSAGDARETFRTLQYLEVSVKWQVYSLRVAGVLAQLERSEWAQMLAEASRQELDELRGWEAMYDAVGEHCPPEVLLIVQQQTRDIDRAAQEDGEGIDDDGTDGAAAFDDRAQLEAMFSALGPAAFLALATRTANAADIDHNYRQIRDAGKVVPTIEGLELGAKMGTRTAAHLKRWFETDAASVAEATKMFERRFNLTLTGSGSYAHDADDKDGNPKATLSDWTKPGLRLMWNVCEALPPQSIEQNPRLVYILRDRERGPGSAYYAGPRQRAEGDVLMGYRNDDELDQLTGDPTSPMYRHQPIYQEGGAGVDTDAVQMPTFNATLRHEIGHAVDAQLGIMERWERQTPAGGWERYSSWAEFVDAIISSAGGMSGHGYPDEDLYRQAMIDACEKNITFSAALEERDEESPDSDPGGPVSAVWEQVRYRPANNTGPWYRNTWATQGGRNFQSAYGSTTSLYSFVANARDQHMVTSYQWRAPGEWFAEVYQVYYAEQEDDPNAPIGGRLRSKDPYAANMMANVVDVGHSPQGMAGGRGSTPAPGTRGGGS